MTLNPSSSHNLIDGVNVSGTPSSGQVITATSATAATWQTPASPAAPTGYLTANGDSLTASGNHTWTASGNSGTDVTVDAGDHTKIDFNTTGLYVVSYQSDFAGDATGAGATLARPTWSASPDWAAHLSVASPQVTVIPANYEDQFLTTLAPLQITAGVWMRVSPIIVASAGTITVTTSLVVRRIA